MFGGGGSPNLLGTSLAHNSFACFSSKGARAADEAKTARFLFSFRFLIFTKN